MIIVREGYIKYLELIKYMKDRDFNSELYVIPTPDYYEVKLTIYVPAQEWGKAPDPLITPIRQLPERSD